jgi:Zn ribbon nucleic-acid-binding protein
MESRPNPQDSLENQITKLLGFTPETIRELGGGIRGYAHPGWLYRGAAAATCPGCKSSSEKHVWEQPEVAAWAVVCTQCGVARALTDFADQDVRVSLSEAQIGHIEPPPIFRVGFFCCGPCPEAVALIELLNSARRQLPRPGLPDNYPLVFEAFKAVHADVSATKEHLRDRLKELQPHFKLLRKTYNEQYRSRSVEIEYSGGIADAYLLAYAPGNINQARIALGHALTRMSRNQRLALSSRRLKIEFHLFDLQTTGWSQITEALLDLGCTRKWEGELDVHRHQFDIRNSEALPIYQETLQALDLSIFQNFDNEIARSGSAERALAEGTMTKIAEGLHPEAQLILSDLTEANVSQQSLRERWKGLGIGEITISNSEPGTRTKIHDWPRIPELNEYFFSTDDGEWRIPRIWLPSLNILVFKRA